MSYSFSVTAASKAEAVTAAEAKFAEVVNSQPVHAADKEPTLAAISAFVGILVDPSEGEAVYLSVNGSVGWRGDPNELTSASANISAGVRLKEPSGL